MNRIATSVFSLCLLVGSVAPAVAEVAPADQSAFRGIVTSQIEAFRSDDGALAYSFASPMIRGLFPTEGVFMEMVRKGYPPVYRPESFAFGPVFESNDGPVQRVFITAPDGTTYTAEYTFEQQPDGSWKINGVTLKKDDSPTI